MIDDVWHFTTSVDNHRRLDMITKELPDVAAAQAVHKHIDNTIDRNTLDWPVTVRLYETSDAAQPAYVYALHPSLRPMLLAINGITVPSGDMA